MNYRIPMIKLSIVRDGSVISGHRAITCSVDSAEIARTVIGDNDREEFIVLLLDTRYRVIGVHSVALGTLSLCIVHPREVYKAAILSNACAIVLAHNHPSGDATPSKEDLDITKRLTEAGRLLGISVLDHVIIGAERSYYSLADNGRLNG